MKSLRLQSGIAIAPILFIVALIAILATAIAAGTSTFSGSTDGEKSRTAAATLIHYGEQVQVAVARMLARGINPLHLSFSYVAQLQDGSGTETTPANKNDNCTSNECEVFTLEGGGVKAQDFSMYTLENPPGWQPDWRSVGSPDFAVYKAQNTGTSASELLMIVYYILPGICDQINSMIGLTVNPVMVGPGPHQGWGGNVPSDVFTKGLNFNNTQGKTMFCMKANDGLSGNFYVIVVVN